MAVDSVQAAHDAKVALGSVESFHNRMMHLGRPMVSQWGLKVHNLTVAEMMQTRRQELAVQLPGQMLKDAVYIASASNNFQSSEAGAEYGCNFPDVGLD